ncbi:MAG: DUF4293 domain-containing protein [Chitinophagaceae bacterium]
MIQRMQSIWLFLAAVAAFLSFKFSFFSGNFIGPDKVKVFKSLTASGNLVLLTLTVAVGVVALVAIFLYKNRKLQMRFTLATLLMSLLTIILYYNQTQLFVEGKYDLTAVVTLLVPIFLVLAARGIYKDQKLIRSLDRLR